MSPTTPPLFQGTYVALVTPFANGIVDEAALEKLIEWHLSEGVRGFVPCGTTGESATLSHEEHNRVIGRTIEIVRKRAQVIAGTGSNSTAEAIALTRNAKAAGADGALLISPYYNKPTQRGLYEHFKAVAEAVDLPLIPYNIPGRTAVTISNDTLLELAKIRNIVGVKEATGSIEVASHLAAHAPPHFAILAGDDLMTLPVIAVGGHGVISASANVVPRFFVDICNLMAQGNLPAARAVHLKMVDLIQSFFSETNPIPVKKALELMGLVGPEIRLPLTPMSEPAAARMATHMRALGLIK